MTRDFEVRVFEDGNGWTALIGEPVDIVDFGRTPTEALGNLVATLNVRGFGGYELPPDRPKKGHSGAFGEDGKPILPIAVRDSGGADRIFYRVPGSPAFTIQSGLYRFDGKAFEPVSDIAVRVFRDGDAWCALQGDNLQEGIAGFGVTPADALLGLSQELRRKGVYRTESAESQQEDYWVRNDKVIRFPEPTTEAIPHLALRNTEAIAELHQQVKSLMDEFIKLTDRLDRDTRNDRIVNWVKEVENTVLRLSTHYDAWMDRYERQFTDLNKQIGGTILPGMATDRELLQSLQAEVGRLVRGIELKDCHVANAIEAMSERIDMLEEGTKTISITPADVGITSAELLAAISTLRKPDPVEEPPAQKISDATLTQIAEAVTEWVKFGSRSTGDTAQELENRLQSADLFRDTPGQVIVVYNWLKEVLNGTQPN